MIKLITEYKLKLDGDLDPSTSGCRVTQMLWLTNDANCQSSKKRTSVTNRLGKLGNGQETGNHI